MTQQLTVEPTGSHDHGPCACCGNMSRCVWGFVHGPQGTVAAYFVHWTLGRVADHDPDFDLVLGPWGERGGAGQRVAVALKYRVLDNGPSFMVIDAAERADKTGDLAGKQLQRAEVVGQPIAKQAFAVVDAILVQDNRVAELLGDWRITSP
jgi:hypothetical protein